MQIRSTPDYNDPTIVIEMQAIGIFHAPQQVPAVVMTAEFCAPGIFVATSIKRPCIIAASSGRRHHARIVFRDHLLHWLMEVAQPDLLDRHGLGLEWQQEGELTGDTSPVSPVCTTGVGGPIARNRS
jgi:hypothetical protein